MDSAYMTKMATSFLEELSAIEKQAQGIIGTAGKFLSRGFGALGGLAEKGGLQRLKNVGVSAYQKGAAGKGGVLGGVKGFMGSQAGQAATAAGLTGLGAYGGYKALGGGSQQGPYYR